MYINFLYMCMKTSYVQIYEYHEYLYSIHPIHTLGCVCAYRMSMLLQLVMGQISNVPPKSLVILKVWLPACGAVGGSETFRRWDLVNGSQIIGGVPLGKILGTLAPTFLSFSASSLLVRKQFCCTCVSTMMFCFITGPKCQGQVATN